MNLIFIVLAALLVSVVVLRLGLVLWRGPRTDGHLEHHVVNASVLRDQLAELDRDRRNGTLSEQDRSEEHTSELQSLMRNSYAVFCLKKKKKKQKNKTKPHTNNIKTNTHKNR